MKVAYKRRRILLLLRPPTLGGYVRLLARLSPFSPSVRPGGWLDSALERGAIFVPTMTYVRFMISSIFYPLLAEIPVVLLIPPPLSLALVSLLLLGQTVPVVIPRVQAWQRRRAVEAELPFVGMLLFVLSHESFPNIVDAFSKIRELGSDVFPGMFREASSLVRHVAYVGTSVTYSCACTIASQP